MYYSSRDQVRTSDTEKKQKGNVPTYVFTMFDANGAVLQYVSQHCSCNFHKRRDVGW